MHSIIEKSIFKRFCMFKSFFSIIRLHFTQILNHRFWSLYRKSLFCLVFKNFGFALDSFFAILLKYLPWQNKTKYFHCERLKSPTLCFQKENIRFHRLTIRMKLDIIINCWGDNFKSIDRYKCSVKLKMKRLSVDENFGV